MALTKVSRGLLTTSIVDNGNATAITIDASENVGIGVSNPSDYYAENLVVGAADEGGITIKSGTTEKAYLMFADGTSPGDAAYRGYLGYEHGNDSFNIFTSNYINFYTGDTGANAERMRIDASGNLLVGKTTTDNTTAGTRIHPAGYASFTIANDFPIIANRLSSDGSVAVFRKDGSTVGKINTVSTGGGSMIIGNDSSGIMFRGDLTTSAFIPASPASNAQVDNTLDVGHAAIRFDDIYATNPTIQTSDRNEKQDIEELSDAEQRVAVACKGLLRKFRWIDAVEAKGDEARIHFGIIAQDLQAAFEAEGLDAGRYAMFISSTWWETQTEVAAVEATEDTEAVDAYTRTDTYHTAEAAPEGATERTRLGIRSSELLAFIISAI